MGARFDGRDGARVKADQRCKDKPRRPRALGGACRPEPGHGGGNPSQCCGPGVIAASYLGHLAALAGPPAAQLRAAIGQPDDAKTHHFPIAWVMQIPFASALSYPVPARFFLMTR